MPPPEAARTHYTTQRTLARRTAEVAGSIWAGLPTTDLDQSWAREADRLYVTVSVAQQRAAASADGYIADALDEQGITARREARVNARAFAGVASDGRDLESLLYQPVITTKTALTRGAQLPEAMAAGQAALLRIVATQIQDAGRTAVGVGIAARPGVGWVRMLQTPSCSRCAVLAGKFFRWNKGFARHPMCDCVHCPSAEDVADDLTTDTDAYFRSLSKEDQDRYFTKAGAEAIRAGSDVGQVVNARRKGAMYQADGHLFTREGTTRRGFAGKRLEAAGAETTRTLAARRTLASGETRSIYQTRVQRIMPETIFREARDREHAIELLRRHGYLT